MDNNDPDLYQTVSRLGERVSALEQRVGDAYSVVNQTSVVIGTVNGRLDSLDQSMTRLAMTVMHELSEQNRRLEGFENRMAGIDNSLNEFRRELEDKIDRANNRTVGSMALMFGAVVGLITYF